MQNSKDVIGLQIILVVIYNQNSFKSQFSGENGGLEVCAPESGLRGLQCTLKPWPGV